MIKLPKPTDIAALKSTNLRNGLYVVANVSNLKRNFFSPEYFDGVMSDQFKRIFQVS